MLNSNIIVRKTQTLFSNCNICKGAPLITITFRRGIMNFQHLDLCLLCAICLRHDLKEMINDKYKKI